MFDRIAPVYDAMNRAMTAGLDLRWRRLAAAAVVRDGDRVLDAACGTGDFSLALGRLVPLAGRLLPGGGAYGYLPASVKRFPGAEELAGVLERCGFANVRFRLIAGSIVALHTAVAR